MTHTLPAWLLGAIRAAGVAAIIGLLSWAGVASNLTFLNPGTATVVAMLALAIENSVAAKGPALFGAVKRA